MFDRNDISWYVDWINISFNNTGTYDYLSKQYVHL